VNIGADGITFNDIDHEISKITKRASSWRDHWSGWSTTKTCRATTLNLSVQHR